MTAAAWVPEDADISELREAAQHCRGCELWEPATQVVFSAGNPRAPLVLVGEQPGDAEDRQGVPFVGPAGKVLQRGAWPKRDRRRRRLRDQCGQALPIHRAGQAADPRDATDVPHQGAAGLAGG